MTAKRATGEPKGRPQKPVTERLIDEALEDTFPASDPPFFVGGGAKPAPTKPERRTRKTASGRSITKSADTYKVPCSGIAMYGAWTRVSINKGARHPRARRGGLCG